MKNRYIQIFSFLIALLLFATPPACELDDEINFGKSNTTEKDPDDKQELTLDTIGWNIPAEAITVAQAREICMALESGSNTGSKYYVMGYVKKLHRNHASGITGYGNAQFYIEDVKGANSADDFLAYQVYGPDSKKLTDPNEVAVGDFVVIYGALTNYNGTYETVGKGAAYIWKSTNPLLNLPLDNAHKYVDLGLSVKWATCNVGAESPEDYGDYFAWGETQPKSTYNWSTYKWCNGSSSTLTKYNTSSSYGTVDNKTVLEAADDAATANWGGAWRMPTQAEQDELREQCTWTWTTQNGVNGYRVTSKSNGNSIFLPAAGYRDVGSRDYVGSFGYYWSSTLVTDNPNDAYYLYFNSGNVDWYINYRYFGLSVRPVLGENKGTETTVPTVTTAAITQITETTAVAGGNVTSDGGASVTERGVVYATTQNPTINSTKVTSGIGTGSFTCNLTDLQPNTTYYVRAYATNEVGTAYGEEVTFTTAEDESSEPTGTENEYGYVDLGLSIKWATMNVGASKLEDYGDYFAWGETQPKSTYNWSTYKYCNGSSSTLTKYNTDSSYGTVDNKTTLDLSDDAANANWGGSWRMPTDAEWTELRENCTWKWTTQNGVNGYRVTSKSNGNSIFLPAAGYRYGSSLDDAGSYGYYWSSSLNTVFPYNAYRLTFYSSYVGWRNYDRQSGQSVRPVLGENKVAETTAPTITTTSVTQITESSAVAGGNVTSDGGASVTERGVVYATTQNPTTNNTKVMSGTGTGSFTCNLTGLQANTTYYVRAYAVNSKGIAYGEEVSFTTKEQSSTPNNGTENGYAYVDLGLSVKWATMNVGASKAEEYGDYFAWGETTTKTTYDWSTYKWCNGSSTTLTKYNTSSSNGTVDNKTELDAIDDAAVVNWGGSWRMPTDAEWTELREQCTWTWITQNGVYGRKATSKANGNSIFLPAAGYHRDSSLNNVDCYGYYWSSSLSEGNQRNACDANFDSSSVGRNGSSRCYGRSVRPVCP